MQQRGHGGWRSLPVVAGLAALAVVALAAGLASAGVAATRSLRPSLGPERTGDAALAARVERALGDGAGRRALAVAWLEDGTVRTAGLGSTGGPADEPVDGDTPFEVGSVAKAMTGMLLADMAAAGEVRLDERVGDLVPGTALAVSGESTLAELSTHRSGLPTLPPAVVVRGPFQLVGRDPWVGSPAQALTWAGEAGAPGGAEPAYSNQGVGVLGSALAHRAGTSYGELLTERLLRPLGMSSSTVVTASGELPAGRAHGTSARGLAQEPWIAPGYAAAGVGVWSTAGDLARLADAALDGSAPGSAATEPRAELSPDHRVGLGWLATVVDGREVVWHNGGTGGFRSFVGIDRERGRAVVVLSSTSASVDELGMSLLTGTALE